MLWKNMLFWNYLKESTGPAAPTEKCSKTAPVEHSRTAKRKLLFNVSEKVNVQIDVYVWSRAKKQMWTICD